MFLARVLTGVVGGALVLAAIHFGELPFFFLILGISVMALKEFYTLVRSTGYAVSIPIGLAGGALLVGSIFLRNVAKSSSSASGE